MGVDVHGRDSTKAACRAVSDAIRHSSLPLFQDVRERGGRMLVHVTVGVPHPDSVKGDVVRRELPHGGGTARAVNGGPPPPSPGPPLPRPAPPPHARNPPPSPK